MQNKKRSDATYPHGAVRVVAEASFKAGIITGLIGGTAAFALLGGALYFISELFKH